MTNRAQQFVAMLTTALLTSHALSDPAALANDFARAPALAHASLSPDGAWLAYVRQEDGDQQVVLRSLREGGERPTLELQSKRERVRWCEWADAGHLLCGTVLPVRRPDRVSEATRLYVIEPSRSRVRELNPRLPDAIRDNVIDLKSSRSGRVLLQHDPAGKGYPEVAQLDLASGELQRIVRSHPPVSRWISDGGGVVRLGIATDSRTAALYARGADDEWRIVLRQSLDDPNAIAPLVFDRDGLLVLRHHEGRAALFRWQPHSAAAPSLLLADPIYDVDGPLLLDPRTRQLLAVRYATVQETQHYFEEGARSVQRWVDERLPGTANLVVGMTADGRRRLVMSSRDTDPPSLYLHDTTADELLLLGHQYPQLEGREFVPMQSMSYSARDGQLIPAYLTLPRGITRSKLPVVVLPHGGPESRVVQGFDPWVQFLAAQGYAVLQMNFRGSFGYGAAFAAAGVGQWGGVIHADITDGARWLVQQGIADPARICIAGQSFGGYAAMLGAARESQWYACAISYAGVSDLMAFHQYTQRLQSAEIWSERLGADQQGLWQMSPLARVQAIETPIFLMQGRFDPVVPVSQARRFARAMRLAGKPHRFLERVECDHEMTIEACRIEFFAEAAAFLAASLGSAPDASVHRD